MPVRVVTKGGKPIGYQWGTEGKVYLISTYGKARARELAEKQGAAARSSGYMNRAIRRRAGRS